MRFKYYIELSFIIIISIILYAWADDILSSTLKHPNHHLSYKEKLKVKKIFLKNKYEIN